MFSFVTVPDRYPHKCHSCGGDQDREWFLDLGEDNNADGGMLLTIYVCNLCFVAAAKDRGLVYQAPLDQELDALRAELFDYKVKAEGLDHGLRGLIRAGFFPADTPAMRDALDRLPPTFAPDNPGGGAGAAPAHDVHQQGAAAPVADGGAPQPGPGQDLGAVRPGFQLHAGGPGA